MTNRYNERFFNSRSAEEADKMLLRRHPAFLLAMEELGFMSSQTDVITRFRQRRKGKKFSQKRVAELAGLSQSYIARLESGIEKNPRLQSLEKIAKALNMRIIAI